MRKLRVFFTSFKRSLTDISYYRDVVGAKFTFSLKYLYFLMFLLALIKGISIVPGMIAVIAKMPEIKTTVVKVTDKLYPDELVVTIEDGKLSTNVEEPYYIKFPQEIDTNIDGESFDSSEFAGLVVIDTAGDVGDYESYDSLILVTENAIVYPDDDTSDVGGYRVLPLRNIQSDMVIDRVFYDELVGKIMPYFDYAPAVFTGIILLSVLVLPFLLASFYTSGRLLYLLIPSLLLLLFAKLTKRELRYADVYQVSMHTLTAPVILAFVIELFGIRLPFLSFTALFLGITGFVIVKAFTKGAPGQSPTTTSESSA